MLANRLNTALAAKNAAGFIVGLCVLAATSACVDPYGLRAGDDGVPTCIIETTPLPPNLIVYPPRSDVPEVYARFVGIWTAGLWYEEESTPAGCNTLVVLSVNDFGNAQVIYSWTQIGYKLDKRGPKSGWVRTSATISKSGRIAVDHFKGYGYAAYQIEAGDTGPQLRGEYHSEDYREFYVILYKHAQ